MELLWYIIAALGAGIGTGLAGLSAATVAELLSPSEWDTVTVPITMLAAALIIL
jgi:hypothetical protein